MPPNESEKLLKDTMCIYNVLMEDVAERQQTKLLNRSYRRQSLSFDQTSYGIEMNFNAPSKKFLNGKEFLLVRWVAKIQANIL